MSNGWSANDYAITQSSTGIVTNRAISKEFPISAGGALNMVVKVSFSAAVTVVGAMTIKLQTAIGSDYVDSKTATVANGSTTAYIKLQTTLAGDQTFLPLLNKGQVVMTTTNAGDVFSISAVEVLQAL